MKMNTAYLNNKRISDDDISLCTSPGNNSLVTLDDTPSKSKRANTLKLQPRRSALVLSRALALLLVSSPLTDAFAITHASRNNLSTTQLSYRSLHHGPDVQPLTDMEKQGVDFTKMPKNEQPEIRKKPKKKNCVWGFSHIC